MRARSACCAAARAIVLWDIDAARLSQARDKLLAIGPTSTAVVELTDERRRR